MSFQRIAEENNTTKDHRFFFTLLCTEYVRIKDFNVLIDGKSFFDLPVKIEEAYKKIMDMSNNNDYITGNLLDCLF